MKANSSLSGFKESRYEQAAIGNRRAGYQSPGQGHGFQVLRQRGSHVYLKHSDGRATVVPVHKGESVGRGRASEENTAGCRTEPGGIPEAALKSRTPIIWVLLDYGQ